MSKLNAGEVVVKFQDKNGFDKEIILKPSMRAAQMISRNFNGFAAARTALAGEQLEAAVYILRIGSGYNDRDTKDWDQMVFDHGLNADLLVPLIKYVGVLGNGGKPLPDDPDTAGGETESSASEKLVTLAEYWDLLYAQATGWLGWSDEKALYANVNNIELAMSGKVDFVKKTNPWGSGTEEEKAEQELMAQVPAPERAMQQLIEIARRREVRAESNKPKQKSTAKPREGNEEAERPPSPQIRTKKAPRPSLT